MPKPFKPSVKLTDNDVTNEDVYKSRRSLLKSMGFVGASTLLAKSAGAAGWFWEDEEEKAGCNMMQEEFFKAGLATCVEYVKDKLAIVEACRVKCVVQ